MDTINKERGNRRVIFDIEADSLNPTVIWCVVCKDIDTDEVAIFRRPDLSPEQFLSYWSDVVFYCGHNVYNYDCPALRKLVKGYSTEGMDSLDTLVLSRLLDYSRRGGHSLESWGVTLKYPKTDFHKWDELTDEMVEYCVNDVHLNHLVYKKLLPWIESKRWQKPIETEMFIAQVCQDMHDNGFHFAIDKCRDMRYNILEELQQLDEKIISGFSAKVRSLSEITPRATQFGTINRSDFRWVPDGDLSPYSVGAPFTRIDYEEFNPGSVSQIVERLNEAGWQPVDKTKGHLQALRDKDPVRVKKFADTGWMVNETNLATLPDTAPPAARHLALRLTLASRSRTLTEWIDAYNPDTGRIHGRINSLGAWTHRASHVQPNTGNIPTPQPVGPKSTELQHRAHGIDSQLRTYWEASPGGYLVGVDAEGIQLRVLAHYINDERFTRALIEGKKEDGTDPHSLNKRALGDPCRSRDAAKTFIYAWLLGAGIGKVSQILECSHGEAKRASTDFVEFYPGLADLKRGLIPRDARRGYFEGFDGRFVGIAGDDLSSREHYTLAGYLQNGETIIMRRAKQIWYPRLRKEGVPFKLVNFIHDEWQTDVPDRETADYIARIQADSIRQAGEELNLRCPMAGSINIGRNWQESH
jgi:DNA polymerase-1